MTETMEIEPLINMDYSHYAGPYMREVAESKEQKPAGVIYQEMLSEYATPIRYLR
jgi:hypothetical protein